MTRFDPIDEIARETAARIGAPALVHGVIEGGALVHAGAVGSLSDGAPPDEHSVFRIASMTKSFTAALVLLLRDRGELSLDQRVEEVLPGTTRWQGRSPDEHEVTIRDLLSMGSGLATDDAWADRHLDLTPDAMLAILRDGRAARANGGGFEYSNLGYGLVGEVVRAITGRRLQDLVTAELLEPLGMRSTVWSAEVLGPDRRIAAPHRRVADGTAPEGAPPPGDGALAPMGGLWSTVDDLSRWVAFLLDAHPPRGDADHGPLRRASRREMQRGHRAVGLAPVPGRGLPLRRAARSYGFGLQHDEDEVLGTVVDHSGGLPGYGSNMRWLPDRGVGVVALANVTYAPMRELTYRQLDAMHRASMLPPRRDDAPEELSRTVASLRDLLLAWSVGARPADADAATRSLFADNVEPDESLEQRAATVRRIAEQHGPLSPAGFVAQTRAAGLLHLVAADGVTLEVLVELAPYGPARVQRCALTVHEPPASDGRSAERG